jgi:hypothetical protein
VHILSRDRASTDADGARPGAPQAVPVADRWHLLKNVSDVFERLLQGQPEAVWAAARAVSRFRLAAGKITEYRVLADNLAIQQQVAEGRTAEAQRVSWHPAGG